MISLKNFKYITYRFLWNNAVRLPLRKMPVHLDLELTSRCNLKCIMCPHGEEEGRKFNLGDMPLDMAKDLIMQGAGKIKSIKFNWRGEPTLYKHLPEVIYLAKNSGYIDTMINTNLNCSSEVINNVISSGIDKIIVSIDSFDSDTYSRIRRNGDLDLVLHNLELIKRTQESSNRSLKLIIQARRQHLNKHEVFPEEVFVKPATQRTDNGEYLVGDSRAVGRKNCLMPFKRLLVSWDGKIFGCCANWFEIGWLGKKITDNLDLELVWKSGVVKKLRDDLKSGKAFTYEPCKTCFSRESYIWEK